MAPRKAVAKNPEAAPAPVADFDLGDDILGAAQDVDQDSLQEEGPVFPIIVWRGGTPELQSALSTAGLLKNPSNMPIAFCGGFFMDEGAIPASDEEMEAAGFHKDKFTTKEGQEVLGWSSQLLHVAIVAARKHIVVNDGAQKLYFPSTQWDQAKRYGSPRVHRNFLVVIRGLEAYAPFVLTFTGTAGMAFHGDREFRGNGVMPSQKNAILDKVNASLRKSGSKLKYGNASFYIPVGVNMKKAKSGDYIPHFLPLGQPPNITNAVVPTYLGKPREESTGDDAKALFVGVEQNRANQEIWAEFAKDWIEAWSKPSAEAADVPAEKEDEEIDTDDLEDEMGW